MNTFTSSDEIKCGDHALNAEVTITERLREKNIGGRPITLKEPPTIIVRCATCGRETSARNFTIDTQLIERLFQ